MRIDVSTEQLELFKCLSSETRLKMIQLMEERPRNLREMASILKISPGIVTRHVDALEKCHIIRSEITDGQRGLQKICRLNLDEATLVFHCENNRKKKSTALSIPVGQYTKYNVKATCGLCSTEWFIGLQDDPRYFSTPERNKAGLVWFASGWLEYTIPSFAFSHRKIKSISIAMEICSEAPDYNDNYPSDIFFSFNGKCIGYWTSPGDFGTRRGRLTPAWWIDGCQYGMLKTIFLTREGVMIDGEKVSDLTLQDILGPEDQDLIMRIASPEDATNPGGVTIHGRGFGNYDRDIEVEFDFEED